jgi:hypothetical protein
MTKWMRLTTVLIHCLFDVDQWQIIVGADDRSGLTGRVCVSVTVRA